MKRVLVSVFGVLYLTLSGMAMSANEGICDDLVGHTRGLFGLCIAFNQGQDCEVDFAAEDPFQNCTPGSEKVLERYRAMRQAGDPDMPGVQAPCPCWTEAELDEVGGGLRPDGAFGDRCRDTASFTTSLTGFDVYTSLIELALTDSRQCLYVERPEWHRDCR